MTFDCALCVTGGRRVFRNNYTLQFFPLPLATYDGVFPRFRWINLIP